MVGYTTYLELVPPELLQGKDVHSTGMMKEVDRCNAAIDLAVQGKNAVVVSSGDAACTACPPALFWNWSGPGG